MPSFHFKGIFDLGNTQVLFSSSAARTPPECPSLFQPASRRSNCKVKTITPSDCVVSFAHPQADVWDDLWMAESTVQTVRHTRQQESWTVALLPLARRLQGASRPRWVGHS